MPWTVSLKKMKEDGGKRLLRFDYTDGKRVVSETFDTLGGLNVQAIASQKIKALEAQDSIFDAIEDGPLPIEAQGTLPTPEETEQADWNADYFALAALQNAVDKGLLDTTDKTYAELLSSVKSRLKPEYLTGAKP